MTVLRRVLPWVLAACCLGRAAGATPPQPADCPPAARPPSAEEQAAGWRDARDRGMLWRLEKDGRTSWLYGTIHIGKTAWVYPGPTVRAALEDSDTLALELDPLDPAVLGELQAGMVRDPKLTLTPALDRRLRAQLRRACLPETHADQVAPEMLAANLTMAATARDGFHTAFGIDVSLAQVARAMNKPVASLETVSLQLASLVSANETDLRGNMARMLADLEQDRVRPLALRLARAWETGRDEELGRFTTWCNCVRTPRDRAQMKALLEDRNPGLAAAVDRLHAGGQSVFAAVGSLHLVGASGLPALLAERGYTVTREPLAPR